MNEFIVADVLIANFLIVYHGGCRHTAQQAAAVHEGAASLPGVLARRVQVADVDANALALFARADAIVFGAPTYMGGPSADFKRFADSTSNAWATQAWKNKIAGGFTSSDSLMGDTHATLQYFCSLAVQHAMIWVGEGLPPSSSGTSARSDQDQLAFHLGAAARSHVVDVPDRIPSLADLDTAYRYGRRIARIALCLRGASSPNVVVDRNEMSLAREIPSLAQRASG